MLKSFSKLDLSSAYLQFPLDEESKKYTHKGLFQYSHLPFGVASAPAIFQCHMETLMQGRCLPGRHNHHWYYRKRAPKTLNLVLERLQSAGLHLNRAKCFFLQPKPLLHTHLDPGWDSIRIRTHMGRVGIRIGSVHT